MKWYFCLNESAKRGHFEAAKVALHTCLEKTSLEPHAIFDGREGKVTKWLRRNGVTVHFRSLPFVDTLQARAGIRGLVPAAARGAYLRVMIPEVEKEDDYVLYTDCDVLFQHDPVERLAQYAPRFLAATPESAKNDVSFFNSGVMLINAAAWREKLAGLIAFIDGYLPYWNGFSCNDQGALNYFFRGAWDVMSLEMNWKPYWGRNDAAWIIHQHGNRAAEVVLRLGDGVPGSEKSATRRKTYASAEGRGNVLFYAKSYFNVLNIISVDKTSITQAIYYNNMLYIWIHFGEEVEILPSLVLYLIEDGAAKGGVSLAEPSSYVGQTRCYVVDASAQLTGAARARTLIARDFGWLEAPVSTVLDAPPAGDFEEVAFVSFSEYLLADVAETPSPDDHAGWIQPPSAVNRLWALPGTSFRIDEADPEAIRPVAPEALPRWRSRTGGLTTTAGRSGFLSPDPRRSPGVACRIAVDAAMSWPDRLFAALVQIAGIEAAGLKVGRAFSEGDPSDLDASLLELLGIELHAGSGRQQADEGGEPIYECSGSGLRAELAPVAVDRLVRSRRSAVLEASPQPGVVLLGAGTDDSARRLSARLAEQGGMAVVETAPGIDTLTLLSRTPFIAVLDPALAPLIAIAAPHANVMHVKFSPADSPAVRHLCAVRNLHYSAMELLGGEMSEAMLEKIVSLTAEVMGRLLKTNVVTESFSRSPAVPLGLGEAATG